MDTDETVEVDGLLGEQLRVALLIGVHVARRQLERRRRLAATQTVQARQRVAQLDRLRAFQLAALDRVNTTGFWERATPEEIREAWQTALTYRDCDPQAEHAYQQIAAQLEQRYHIHTPELAASLPDDPGRQLQSQDERLAGLERRYTQLTDQHPENERLRERRADLWLTRAAVHTELHEHHDSEIDQTLQAEQAQTAQTVDRVAAASAAVADVPYDSVQRRAARVERMRADEIGESAIEAVMLADLANAHPPKDATGQPAPAARHRPGSPLSARAREAARRRGR